MARSTDYQSAVPLSGEAGLNAARFFPLGSAGTWKVFSAANSDIAYPSNGSSAVTLSVRNSNGVSVNDASATPRPSLDVADLSSATANGVSLLDAQRKPLVLDLLKARAI
jgi:hypothetical protein